MTGKGFVPGESGNPSGRPRDLIGRVIRQWEEDNDYPIVNVLTSIVTKAEHPDVPSIRVRASDVIRAAEILLDRGYGKAPLEIIHGQTDNHTGVFDHLPMPKLQALLKVIDTLESSDQLDELILDLHRPRSLRVRAGP